MYYAVVTHRKCIAKHMINHRISADWSTTKVIAAFTCTPRVQEVHTKAEFVHITPGLLGLGLLYSRASYSESRLDNCPQNICACMCA